ncbi:hypothetical protein BH10PSE11_BH10PSE11_16450 [soil metagenome]
MIKKFLSKYILEVIPSIFATVVGAYIVTHYVNAKTDDKPKTAISAPAETSKDVAPETLKADESADRASKETPKAEAARLKAEKLAAEKAFAERAAADRAENARKAAEKLAAEKTEKLAAEKLASDKAAAEKREKAVAKSAPVVVPAVEANAVANDKRDANDLARAAIERLRNNKNAEKTSEPSRAPETARADETVKPQLERAKVNSVVYAPAAAPQPQLQPLPPAVTVAPPPSEAAVMAPPPPFPTPISGSAESADDSLRLTPPADIPSRPLDLRAKQRRSVTEDVVSAAKSVFHAVVPEQSN